MPKNKKILFLVPYPLNVAPSQRFRVELFLPLLKMNGIEFDVQSFFDEKTWNVLYNSSSFIQKTMGVIKGFLRRIKMLFLLHRYEFVFIHREASPIGPPIFEFIMAKLFRKKIIFDFDDALWITDQSNQNPIAGWIKANWKIKYICKWSYKVIGGNEYLCNYAKQFCNDVVLIPTCVDTKGKHNRLNKEDREKVSVGWTGSHSTMKYLDKIVPLLERLVQEFGIQVIIISNKKPSFTLSNMQFIQWNEENEVDDLLKIDIGIMPLEADPWCEGKCGFKLIQYMSLCIPAIASPVGVNKKIIEQGINGFLCETERDWHEALAVLINNHSLRKEMGIRGQEKIIQQYSVLAHERFFLSLFSC